MNDSFGNIIYIVIVLVAFVISALGKKKKKNTTHRPVRTVNDTNTFHKQEKSFISNIEQLLNEELGFETNYHNAYEKTDNVISASEKEVALDTVPPEMLDNIPDVPYSIEYDEDTHKIFENTIKDSEIKNIETINPILKDFDLRKAVIFSEILNRKEY